VPPVLLGTVYGNLSYYPRHHILYYK